MYGCERRVHGCECEQGCTDANEMQIRKKNFGQCSLSELKVPCKNSGSLECTDANEECTDAKASKSVRMRAKRKIEKKLWAVFFG